MAKTPGFKAFSQAIQRALLLQRHPELKNAFCEYESASRENKERRHRDQYTDFDRRDFLKLSLALGLAASPFASACASVALPRNPENSVAVLGGGLAGLTAAYRLAKAGWRPAVFEGQARLGGRVFTHNNFNSEGMFCELGGELIDSTHTDMIALAAELGLPLDDFRPYDAKVKEHHFYINRQHYFDDDLTDACGPLAARIAADMKNAYFNAGDTNVTYDHHTEMAKKIDGISLAEYLHSTPDLEKWVRDGMDVAYLTEFGLDTAEQSTLNLFSLINPDPKGFGVYGTSDESRRIRGGNSRLVEGLAKIVESKCDLHLNHRLLKIKDLGSSFELTFQSAGKTQTVKASRIVCTLPFSVLREIEGVADLDFGPVKQKAIQQLGYGSSTKHMVGFKTRAWRKRHGSVPGMSGYTFTDLPSQTLWDSSRVQPGESGILTTFLGGSAANDLNRGSLDSILSDVEAMHQARALYDGNHVMFRWGRHPFSHGSYSAAKVGQYTSIIGAAKEPELNGRMQFAGEHVSESAQGYMNGAVQTGNIAARMILGGTMAKSLIRIPSARVPAGVNV